MRFHPSTVARLVKLFELYGGRKDNTKLSQEIQSLDLTKYTQKENPRAESFLVLTEDLKKVNG